MTKKSRWQVMNKSDITMKRQHDIVQDESATIPPHDFSPKGHMRYDEQNDISPNHGRIRRPGAIWSWCVVLSIVIGPVCFLDDSGADEGGMSTSSSGGSCDSLPSITQAQPGTEGSASNCQKQDGDLVAHVYNTTRLHFYRIEKPFDGKSGNVVAAFVTGCTWDKPSPGRCLDYADAYKQLRDLAFGPTSTPSQDMVNFDASLHYVQTDGKNSELVTDNKKVRVRVPRLPKALTSEEKKRLVVRTTLTRWGAKDHENDQWRSVQVDSGVYGLNSLVEMGYVRVPEWTNICGENRLAMIMFARVNTNYPHSWSPLSLDMVLKLKPKSANDNTDYIDTNGLEMVIACETSMTAKCAYEHGYRPWAELKDRKNRAVPPEDVAALLSTCALASTQCTREGKHIVVIDDLGMNRPYPLDYGKTYFAYEATFRYKNAEGPHREHVCRLRDVEISARCKASYGDLESTGCQRDEHTDRKEANYDDVAMIGYLDLLLLDPTLPAGKEISPEETQISPEETQLLITEDGRWFAGMDTNLHPSYNGGEPPFGTNNRRVVILSQPALLPTQPAGALSNANSWNLASFPREINLGHGHFYARKKVAQPKDLAGSMDAVKKYLRGLAAFDHVTCRMQNASVACFLYRSKKGIVKFPHKEGRPDKLFQYYGSP